MANLFIITLFLVATGIIAQDIHQTFLVNRSHLFVFRSHDNLAYSYEYEPPQVAEEEENKSNSAQA